MRVVHDTAISSLSGYNEAEIRFHVIDPVLRALGYPELDDTYLFLEEKLEYPYLHIGRRSKRDMPIGYADYRAGVKGARGSFVVEAKAGNVPILKKDIEQAHSYAAHAQVGANFFVLCNGEKIVVYETLSGPSADPIVDLPLAALNERFHELENILAPDCLKRHCAIEFDRGLRLLNGFGSTARIASGKYLLSHYDIRIIVEKNDVTKEVLESVPEFKQALAQMELFKSVFEMRVSKGCAYRDEAGKIVANLEFQGATIQKNAAMQIMGIESATFTTADKFISLDADNPTIFESVKDFSVSRGTILPQLLGGEVEIANDVSGSMFIKAAMHFSNGSLRGEYIAISDQWVAPPGQTQFVIEMDMRGTFHLNIET